MCFYFKQEVLARLSDLEVKMNRLLSNQEKLMAVAQDLLALMGKIDTATNAVADRITALSAQIKNSMTDAEVSAVKSGLAGEADRLSTIAQDPNNPVPPAP